MKNEIEETSEIKKNILHYIKVHRELHGICFSYDDTTKDICTSFPEYDKFFVWEIFPELVREFENSEKQYGIVVGRFQPFTIGHNAIVQDIIRDGKIPIIMIGGINKKDDRHPLSYDERVKLIKKVYPFGCKFIGLEDKDDWNHWFKQIKEKLFELKADNKQFTLYSHNKDIDRQDFEYNGKHYQNEFYTEIFKENGFKIKNLEEFVDKKGKVVHASDIRKNEQNAIKNLDARIYVTLKNKFGWWK